jgi:hypothetical protein
MFGGVRVVKLLKLQRIHGGKGFENPLQNYRSEVTQYQLVNHHYHPSLAGADITTGGSNERLHKAA